MLIPFKGALPTTNDSNFIAQSAQVIGTVSIAEDVNIWFGTVIRSDVATVSIGRRTNVQDNAVVHVSTGYPTQIGDDVTIGHGAIVHGCTVGNRVLIGMGSIVLDGAIIGDDTMIGAGSLIPPGKVIPPKSLVMGSPGKVIRSLTEEEIADLKASAERYVSYAKEYK